MDPLTAVIAALLGVICGSFITLASYRLPRDEGIVVGASHCTSCGGKLKARDLVPLLSWLFTKGHCRQCKATVHWRYPLTEIATAAVFLLIAFRYGLTVEAAIFAVLAVWLLVMIIADFEQYCIPDEVHWVLLPLGIIYRMYMHEPWSEIAGGLALGIGLALGLRYFYLWVRKKEALGWGDVKFFATAGAWLGVVQFVPFLFLAGLLGTLTGLVWNALKKGPRFPFGPALATSLFICAVYPEVPLAFWSLQGIFSQ